MKARLFLISDLDHFNCWFRAEDKTSSFHKHKPRVYEKLYTSRKSIYLNLTKEESPFSLSLALSQEYGNINSQSITNNDRNDPYLKILMNIGIAKLNKLI